MNVSSEDFLKYFNWFWQGRRGALPLMTKDQTTIKNLTKVANDLDNSRRRDIMSREDLRNDLADMSWVGEGEDGQTDNYTLSDYVRARISPEKCFILMQEHPEFGAELLGAIYPQGDGKVEEGDKVRIRTKGHSLNGQVGTLIQKRPRHLYDQFECLVETIRGVRVVLREDELTKEPIELVSVKPDGLA